MKQNVFIRPAVNSFNGNLKYFNHDVHCPIHALRFELFCDDNTHETKCALEYVIEDKDCLTIVPVVLSTLKDKYTHKIYTTNAEFSKLIQQEIANRMHPQLFDNEQFNKFLQLF